MLLENQSRFARYTWVWPMPLSSLRFLTITTLWALTSPATAVDFQVQDQEGRAVANAVIEVLDPQSPTAAIRHTISSMDQINKRFVPLLLTIQAGDQVNFPNSDQIRHHVYSFSPAKPFEIKLYAREPATPITFSQPGVVVLGCNIHDAMVGYIYVAETGWVGQSNEAGQLSLPTDTFPTQIRVWHPALSPDSLQSLTLSAEGWTLRTDDPDHPVALLTLPLTQPARPGAQTPAPAKAVNRFDAFRRASP